MLYSPLPRLVLPLVLLAVASGCDPDAPDAPDTRMVDFEGTEVAQILEASPDARFFVDLRDDTRYGFDQRDVALDFEHFLVQCPSMEWPLPMIDFADLLEVPLDSPVFSLQSTDGVGFRSGDCTTECNAQGGDCVMYCDGSRLGIDIN